MVVQPSIEEHEALINEVKALKEELERVRNEKKETSRSPLEVACWEYYFILTTFSDIGVLQV